MDDAPPKTYSVGDLAEALGISRRAVRYYVQHGVLPPPLGRGRGAHYTKEHVDALKRVIDLQAAGIPLADMRVDEGSDGPVAPPSFQREPAEAYLPLPPAYLPARWLRLEVEDGLELHIRSDRASAASLDILTAAAAFLRANLHPPKGRR